MFCNGFCYIRGLSVNVTKRPRRSRSFCSRSSRSTESSEDEEDELRLELELRLRLRERAMTPFIPREGDPRALFFTRAAHAKTEGPQRQGLWGVRGGERGSAQTCYVL